MTAIEKLTAAGSGSLGSRDNLATWDLIAPHADQLRDLLLLSNGFYAFGEALHVFPFGSAAPHVDLETWNSPDLWRGEHSGANPEHLYFAEDAFGCQFALTAGGVVLFNPENAATEFLAHSIEEWASLILADSTDLLGTALLKAWESAHGKLRRNRRLTYRIPAIIGGDESFQNLVDIDAVELLRFRASIWNQVKHLPPGTQIELGIDE